MTENKQIIIDGVDVSECKHFKNGTCLADYLFNDIAFGEAKCELSKDCYFKQLARKTQECEQKDKDIKYLIKSLDNSFKTQQDSELHWEKERKKLKTEKQQAEQKLEKIKDYVYSNTDFDKDDSIQSNTAGYDILQIIDGGKNEQG